MKKSSDEPPESQPRHAGLLRAETASTPVIFRIKKSRNVRHDGIPG
jgi:hypothetical protein